MKQLLPLLVISALGAGCGGKSVYLNNVDLPTQEQLKGTW